MISDASQLVLETSSDLSCPTPDHRFRMLCIQYAGLGLESGIEIAPFRDGSNQRFLTLPSEIQKAILGNIKTNIAIYESAIQNGVDIGKGSLSVVWWGLRSLGFHPPSSLFSELQNGDIIEVYCAAHIQRFRTFNMFECLSYSMEETFSYEWWELFSRDEKITQRIREIAMSFVNQDARSIVFVNSGAHVIEERFSPRKNRAEADVKFLSPLFDKSGKVAGYLSCTRLIRLMRGEGSDNQVTRPAALPVPLHAESSENFPHPSRPS